MFSIIIIIIMNYKPCSILKQIKKHDRTEVNKRLDNISLRICWQQKGLPEVINSIKGFIKEVFFVKMSKILQASDPQAGRFQSSRARTPLVLSRDSGTVSGSLAEDLRPGSGSWGNSYLAV